MKNVTGKVLLWMTVLVAVCTQAYAQKLTYTVVSSTTNEVVLHVKFPSYESSAVQVNGETMQLLKSKDVYPIEEAGFPALMKTAASIIIPEGSAPTAEILNTEYNLVHNFRLAPSKGKLYRNVDPTTVPYEKGAAYNENRFLYNDTVALGDPYLLRDYYGVPVKFFPFAYNPVQHVLKVYTSMTVRIRFNSQHGYKNLEKVATQFDAIYREHFLNYDMMRSTPLPEEGEMLIIAPQEFCAAMQPYADWKVKMGIPTTIIPLESVGTTSTAVKNYITNYYNNHNLVYVVMVGDDTKFPTIMAGGNISDNYYGEIAGSDKYPDVIIGKISAETVAQVNTQVERFIQYEQNPTETAHFPAFLGVASDIGGNMQGDNGEADYEHIRIIGNVLSNFTYTSCNEVFDGFQGAPDQPGSSPEQVAAVVNNGVGIINYCGHGAETYWVSSNFSVSDVNNLTNVGKLPFIISVACVNGAYSGRTCFAEAWLRATYNGQPTGAVGAVMSTINQPWDSPMCAQDRMIEYLAGANGRTHLNTFGSIVFNGFILMLDNYNDYEVTRTWVLFGDPAMVVRTAVPQDLPLTYLDHLPNNLSTVSFNSTVEDAKVILSKHGEIVASGRIQNGALSLDISALPEVVDTLTVIAWKQNYNTFEGQLFRIPSDGPYVLCTELIAQDGNNNLPEPSETVNYSMKLNNIGNRAAQNVRVNISTEDPYITLANFTNTVNQISAGNTITVNNAFSIYVNPDIPAFHNAFINMEFIMGNDTIRGNSIITFYAPALQIDYCRIDDSNRGNGNGKFDIGETVDLVITVSNQGNGAAPAGRVKFYCHDGSFLLDTIRVATSPLQVGGTQEVRFTASLNPSVVEPTLYYLHADYKTGLYQTKKLFQIFVGAVMEDWENNNFGSFAWDSTSANHWIITNVNAYEGQYAARSAQINHGASSSLSVTHYNGVEDTLSFYYNVSSEEGYDKLSFYIDGDKKGEWSGETGWVKASFLVPAGQHTYKWMYKKDNYVSDGQDRAMIDFIKFPVSNSTVSVEEMENTSIMVYPNPTSGQIQISSDNLSAEKNIYYSLYDLNGRLLQQDRLTESVQTVSLNAYAPGFYILKVTGQQSGNKTFKIVKQ